MKKNLIIIGIGLTLSIVLLYVLQVFYDHFRFRSPVVIKLQRPVVRKYPNMPVIAPNKPSKPKKAPTPSPRLKTEKELIFAQKHGEILWRVYGLESSWGKADYCRQNNLGYGGFGVLSDGQIVCYSTFEKAVERAHYWLIKNGIEKDVATALCRYNTGVEQSDCKYYQNYLSL